MVHNSLVKSLLLALCAGLIALIGAELALRLLIKPDERGYGSFLGVVLPPFSIVQASQSEGTDRSTPLPDLIVDGQAITVGDANGYHRFDAELGYTHLENTRSVNGWWQSNNIGAREMAPTPENVPAGEQRWLLMGESFAHASRVPTEESWPFILESLTPQLDIVNLAVDGYSMAQAYLRYRQHSRSLEHHGVMLIFAPSVDLWRDVNTLRTLGSAWIVGSIMPRFILQDEDGLQLVRSPYQTEDEFRVDNIDGLSNRLRAHLRQYDHFYFPYEHGEYSFIDRSLILKLAAVAYGKYSRGVLRERLWQPGSEALQVSRAIFDAMNQEASDQSRHFALFVLPTEYDLLRLDEEPDYSRQWARLVDFVCEGDWHCIDLSGNLGPVGEIDVGIDGTHFGPGTNRRMASAIHEALKERFPLPGIE